MKGKHFHHECLVQSVRFFLQSCLTHLPFWSFRKTAKRSHLVGVSISKTHDIHHTDHLTQFEQLFLWGCNVILLFTGASCQFHYCLKFEQCFPLTTQKKMARYCLNCLLVSDKQDQFNSCLIYAFTNRNHCEMQQVFDTFAT